ncbi:MAG TPA: ATP-binding protein [Syntrophomonadaceae bacterium]|nr:ATP-binding protein [Syntrophomonadaceae bacterium]
MKSKMIIKQSTISTIILGIFFFIAILLAASIFYMNASIKSERTAEQRRTEFKQLGINLADASDYLTDEARKYAVTQDTIHLQKYWQEINTTKTRDNVISRLPELDSPEEELALLAEAKRYSDALVSTERHSMRLVMEAQGVPEMDMVGEVASYHLSEADQKLNRSQELDKAREIMFDAKYDADKMNIMNPIARFQTIMNARLEADLAAARQATTRAAVVQMILAIIIMCAIAVLIRLLFKQVTYPINNYTERLHVFSFSNESFSLKPEGTQELRMLATTFNELYSSFQEELVKRRQAEVTMKAAKEEAELANNAKSEFLANMSHEIRTPLNTIIGYQYLLVNTELPLKQQKYADKIGLAAKNLLNIINEILDFSKIEAGKMTLENIEFDLTSLLDDVYGMVSIEAQRKHLELTCDIQGDVPRYIRGDITRLKQVILNLLSNAIKFTHEGGVKIRVELLEKVEKQTALRFSVVDTGIGIAENSRSSIFDVFTQENASTSRKYGGTGLGLAICKKIVELMEGELLVESEVGKGSTFIFQAKFIMAENAPSASWDEGQCHSLSEIFKGLRILIIEDNLINLQMASEILESLGFDTDTADSGFAAVDMVEHNSYDAILMDIRMPVMDGYETTRRIRSMPGTHTLPIIALSADAVEGVAERARASGMNGFLTKPLDPLKLVEVLKGFIEIKDAVPDHVGIEESLNSQGAVDFACGIKRIGGKRERYKDILEQFIYNHSQDGQRIQEYIVSDNYPETRRMTHTIKGIAGNIGAVWLQDAARKLEKAVLDQDVAAVDSLFQDFDMALLETCNDSARFISSFDQESKRAQGPENESIQDCLARLLDLLMKFDAQAKSYFTAHQLSLRNGIGDQSFTELKKKISSYRFEEATDDLRKIMAASSAG